MSSSLPDDINALKRLLAEQEALNRALQEKLNEREREIDHLQAQLDKLRRMNFGSRSEKVSRRIAQMEADLKALQKESDTLTGRVDDPAVQRPLRQTRTRKPFPESLPRDEKRLLPAASCCPECGGSLSYLGEDAAEQLELMRSAFRVIHLIPHRPLHAILFRIPVIRRRNTVQNTTVKAIHFNIQAGGQNRQQVKRHGFFRQYIVTQTVPPHRYILVTPEATPVTSFCGEMHGDGFPDLIR